MLPLTNGKLTSAKQAKYLVDQKKAMRDAERYRVGQNVQNVLLREQARDEQLQSRLKKINEKQAARIKQIETQEARNQA